MPNCNRCPINKECNKNPILVKVPGTSHVSAPKGWKNMSKDNKEKINKELYIRRAETTTRLCPFIVLLGNFLQNYTPPKAKADDKTIS